MQWDDVGVDLGDQPAAEGEQVVVGEPESAILTVVREALPGDHDGVAVLDDPIDRKLWTSFECRVLDLVIELRLPVRRAEPVDVPDDVVGQTRENRLVIAALEGVHVTVDDLLLRTHDSAPRLLHLPDDVMEPCENPCQPGASLLGLQLGWQLPLVDGHDRARSHRFDEDLRGDARSGFGQHQTCRPVDDLVLEAKETAAAVCSHRLQLEGPSDLQVDDDRPEG